MYIVRLTGGLGNQMFEYAAAWVAAKNTGQTLKVDALYYRDRSKRSHRFTYRPYALSLFDGIIEASPKEISRHVFPRICNKYLYHLVKRLYGKRNVYTEANLDTYSKLIGIGADAAYLDGFFQKFEYIKHDIDSLRQVFRFKDQLPASHDKIANEIRDSKDSICVVFRRGDYIGHPSLDVVDLDFYYRALEMMPVGRVFAFSDDMAWVEENFKPKDREVIYVSQDLTGPMGGYYLQLMMLCDHFVIPNSTYPYWAALLSNHNPNKKVIVPNLWFRQQDPNARNSIWPEDWITLDITPN